MRSYYVLICVSGVQKAEACEPKSPPVQLLAAVAGFRHVLSKSIASSVYFKRNA